MNSVYTNDNPSTDLSCPQADRTDEQLLLEYRKSGHQAVFRELVHRYEQELFSYLRRYLGNAEMAEDAFQATFLQLHLKCDQFDEGRRLRPWLYMIATNKAIDLQRHNKRHKAISLNSAQSDEQDCGGMIALIPAAEQSPHAELERVEGGEWIFHQLEELPERLRLVVNLVYYQGLTYREAAEALSIPVGTIKSRLHAAITKLTDAWEHSQNQAE